MKTHRRLLPFLNLVFVIPSFAAQPKILTNHLGYETRGPKHAVILGHAADKIASCELKDEATDQTALSITPKASGPVQKWRDWYFWTLDFDSFASAGKYYLLCKTNVAT